MIKELILKNRSYRRFVQSEKIEMETLKELVELARLSPSSSNVQPLRFILSNNEPKNNRIFENCAWAGYLTDWPGPEEGERPSAYIVILSDREIAKGASCDHGIVAQSILLGAVEKGLGGCMIGSIKREKLRESLNIPEKFEILLIIALGVPNEKIVIEPIGTDGSIKYWRDSRNVHHVPKRSLKDIILE